MNIKLTFNFEIDGTMVNLTEEEAMAIYKKLDELYGRVNLTPIKSKDAVNMEFTGVEHSDWSNIQNSEGKPIFK